MAAIRSKFIRISRDLNNLQKNLTGNAQHEYEKIRHARGKRWIRRIQANAVGALITLNALSIGSYNALLRTELLDTLRHIDSLLLRLEIQ